MTLEMTTSLTLVPALIAAGAVAALFLRSRADRSGTGLRVARMIPRADIDLTALARRPALSEGLAGAALACAHCPHGARCDRWLDDPATPGVAPFCPNRDRLAEWSAAVRR